MSKIEKGFLLNVTILRAARVLVDCVAMNSVFKHIR
jgi:hypothetical protein